jgi:hypothetical protein
MPENGAILGYPDVHWVTGRALREHERQMREAIIVRCCRGGVRSAVINREIRLSDATRPAAR